MLDLAIGVSASGDVPGRLHEVYLNMKAWCKDNHLQLHMSDLTRTLLAWGQDADYPVGRLALIFRSEVRLMFRPVRVHLGRGSKELTQPRFASTCRTCLRRRSETMRVVMRSTFGQSTERWRVETGF